LALATGTLKVSYEIALGHLAQQMVLRKSLHPEWQHFKEWLESDVTRSLEAIAARGDICRIANQGRRNVFEFRHDRILEWHLSETVAAEFCRDQPDYETLFDPYMVQVLGHALANNVKSDVVVQLASERLPAS